MKKITLFVGIVSSFLVMMGIAMKLMFWPGAGIMLFAGCTLFALIYAPMLYYNKHKIAQNRIQKFVNILVLLAMMLIVLGFLFKMQHWPGAGIGILTGNILLLILIPVLFVHGFKEPDSIKKMNFINEAIILVLLTSFSFLIWLRNTGRESVNNITTLEENINSVDSLIANNNILAIQSIQSSGTSQSDRPEKVHLLSTDMYNYIKNLKTDILMLTNEFKDTTVLDTLHLKNIMSKSNGSISAKVLFSVENEDPSTSKARALKTTLENYKKAMSELLNEKESMGLNLGLNTDSVKIEVGYLSWEDYTLRSNTLIGALTMLSELQLEVRIAEAAVLNILSSNVIRSQHYEIRKLKNPKDTIL